MVASDIRVLILESAEAMAARAAKALAQLLAEKPDALVSFATGETYRALFAEVTARVHASTLDFSRLRATHLDEYLGYGPEQEGGMVWELMQRCPPLRNLQQAGRFLAVPASGDEEELQIHRALLEALGRVDLQFLGLGVNGHLAFNEPGTPFSQSYSRVTLAASTRESMGDRFGLERRPEEAVSAGPADILAARRLLLLASGRSKAVAVQAMLTGPVGPGCPASLLRRHQNAMVLLDREAAALLSRDDRALEEERR